MLKETSAESAEKDKIIAEKSAEIEKKNNVGSLREREKENVKRSD